MSKEALFGDLPEQASPPRPRGRPRLLEPERDQIELRAVDLESLIGADHRARLFWAYAAGLDLSALEDAIAAREGTPGHPAITPRLLVALWLYATSEGIGSARALARLCESHDAYRWLCGGVSVNHHTLADFRVGQGALLDRLLGESVAALAGARLIDLDALAQDGVRVRASAGAASFRRAATLEEHLAAAHEVVAALKSEVDADPEASNRRIKAARERAARERVARVAGALAVLAEIERKKKAEGKPGAEPETPEASTSDAAPDAPQSQPEKKKKKKEPRASTTDPQARVMKMADGGFRPAYNVQVVSAAGEQIVVSVEPETIGSDRGLIRPALEQVKARHGDLPTIHLADGGYISAKDIEWAHRENVAIHCPPSKSKHGTDPFKIRDDDGDGVRAWRARMASDAGQERYKDRAVCECIHARWRGWGMRQFTVRGLPRVRAVVLWFALVNNILQGKRMAAA